MKKNWIIGALMSVILLCATDVVAQEAGSKKVKAVIDRVYLTLTCECGTSGIKGERAELSNQDKKQGMSVKWDYVCPNSSCKQRWYTSDKNFYIPKKYVNVDESTKPRHICREADSCLVEQRPYRILNEVEIERTLIRQCESTDTLIVQVTLGSEKRAYRMVGKTLSFRTTYRGNIECEYFAPAQHRSAKKPTTQGTNGKRKQSVMLRERR